MKMQLGSGRLLQALGAVLLLSLTACPGTDPGKDPGDGPGNPPPATDAGTPPPTNVVRGPGETGAGESWTVLVYMNADNDLEPFALQDLTEMMQVGSTDKLHLVVEVDRHPGYANDAIGGLPNFSDTKRVLVKQGALEVLRNDLGERQLDTSAELADFIQWGLQAFPADRVAVVFWDHGGGWTGYGVDETSGKGRLLSVPAIAAGLDEGLGQNKVALIGFDACLMANYETALTLSDYADYLLASEEVEPGHGWDWAGFGLLAQTPSSNTEALGRTLIGAYQAQANEARGDLKVTLSLTDLRKLGTLKTALKAFTSKVVAGGAASVTRLASARAATHSFQTDAANPEYSLYLYDLKDLMLNAAEADAALTGEAGQVAQALDAAVAASFAGSAQPGSYGLTVFFPPSADFLPQSYGKLTGAADWRAFLNTLFTGSSSGGTGGTPIVTGKPTFTEPNHTANVELDADTGDLVFWGTVSAETASTVAQSSLSYGISVADTSSASAPPLWVLFGDQTASTVAQESGELLVGSSWDMSALVLSQGDTALSFGYLSLQVEGDYFVMNVPFNSYASTSDTEPQYTLWQLVFAPAADGSGYEVVGNTFYALNGTGWGELAPASGSSLVPLLQVMDASGNTDVFEYMDTGTGFDPTQAIDLSFFTLDPTAYDLVALLTATNANGEGDFLAYDQSTMGFPSGSTTGLMPSPAGTFRAKPAPSLAGMSMKVAP